MPSEKARGRAPSLGAFPAGVYGWFSGRTIVNLDGKVNPEAQRALASGTLYAYVASSGIDYVLDWQPLVYALLVRHRPDGAPIGLQEVARQTTPTTPVVLYRVDRSRP